MQELISKIEGKWLTDLAREALRTVLTKSLQAEKKHFYLSSVLKEKHGLYVSLWSDNKLRGCIGSPFPDECLEKAVQNFAVEAALDDERFSPVSAEELSQIKIEIAILSPMIPIEPREIELGVHGLIFHKSNHFSLLLPEVPIEYGWTVKMFLENLCLKARLSPNDWETGAELYGFETQIIKEHS
jgi:uncharacterized protein